ncbi:thioredoxin domain-containing protein [Actinomyces sp. F1_1611]
MGQKSSKRTEDSVQAKAKAMREAQAKADRRTRNMIIAAVSIIVVAIIAALVFVVTNEGSKNPSPSNEAIPTQFENGEPIVVSHLGVGVRDENLPDLEEYFSYTCSWCAYLDSAVGEKFAEAAKNGEFNYILQPVNTAYMPFQGPATFASLQVAANAPDQFLAFHQALTDYFYGQLQAQDQSVIGNADSSQAQVVTLAQQVGVPEDVINQFGGTAEAYLEKTTKAWTEADVQGREGSLGTPELVFEGSKVAWQQGTPDEIWAGILESLKALGFTPAS